MTEDQFYFNDAPDAARALFLTACQRAAIPVTAYRAVSYENRQPLYCDVARLGSPNAPSVIVLCGGAQGAAGYVHAAICSGFLSARMQRLVDRDVAVLLVHALNPWGFIWPPRTARPGPTPVDGDAAVVHGPSWTNELLTAADQRYATYLQRQGEAAADAEAVARQSGAAFGVNVLTDIAASHLREARHILCLDFRTGPNSWGRPSLTALTSHQAIALKRVRRWFPALREAEGGLDRAAMISGGLAEMLPGTDTTGLIIEFGTHTEPDLLDAVEERSARQKVYPASEEWRQAVWGEAEALLRAAIRGAEDAARPDRKPA